MYSLNQKLCTIFFTSALTQGDFGAILNLIGAFYQINRFVLFAESNVIFGITSKQCPSTKVINYYVIVGKMYLWDSRRNQILLKIKGYQNKMAKKYKIERKIHKKDYFEKKWIFCPGQKIN